MKRRNDVLVVISSSGEHLSYIGKFLIILLTLFFSSCCGFMGSEELGANLVVLEGDRLEDRVLVYCTAESYGCCTGGDFVIPSYDRHMLDGKYSEYIENARSNEKWIVASTKQIQEDKIYYWLIEKEFGGGEAY